MSITPTGFFNAPLTMAAGTLAACEAFQSFVGVDPEGETPTVAAAAKIFYWDVPPDSVTGNFAMISLPESFTREMKAAGPPNQFWTEGFDVELILDGVPPSGSSEKDALIWIANQGGAILADMEEYFGKGGYLNCKGSSLIFAPHCFRDEDNRSCIGIGLAV